MVWVQGLLLLFVLASYNCFCIIKSALNWSSMVACSCSMISLWATDLGPERASPFSVYCGIKVPRKAAINHQNDTASNKNTNGNNAIKIWKETAFQISQYSRHFWGVEDARRVLVGNKTALNLRGALFTQVFVEYTLQPNTGQRQKYDIT